MATQSLTGLKSVENAVPVACININLLHTASANRLAAKHKKSLVEDVLWLGARCSAGRLCRKVFVA